MNSKNEGTICTILFVVIFLLGAGYFIHLIQKEKTNYKNDPALIKEDACKTEKGRDSMDKLIQQLI